LEAAGCALSWCYPIENVMKNINVLFDEEVAKVLKFSS